MTYLRVQVLWLYMLVDHGGPWQDQTCMFLLGGLPTGSGFRGCSVVQ